MDEFPARRRLLGQSDPPRNRPERERGPATPDVVDEDFDLFGAEDAASALIERLKDVQPAATLRSDDGEPLLSPVFDAARDRIEGLVGAARSLVVFGAFGTPTSHALGRLLDDVRERFVTTVNVAWRHYPDPDAHPRAAVLALACEASAAIHTFWSLANELLRLRHNDPIDLHTAMQRARLDPKRALAAMGAGTGADRIVKDVASALASGVTYTPTLFVDGRRYHGSWTGRPSRRRCADNARSSGRRTWARARRRDRPRSVVTARSIRQRSRDEPIALPSTWVVVRIAGSAG